MAYDEHGNWVPDDAPSQTPAGYRPDAGYLWGMGTRGAGGLGGVYDMFQGEGDWGSGWQEQENRRPEYLQYGADDPAWMSWLGKSYYDPGDDDDFVGGPQQMANRAYQQYLQGNEYRTPTAQDIGHGLYGRVIEGKRWDELWPGSGSTPATNDFKGTELQFNVRGDDETARNLEWDRFNRWAHEGAPTGGLQRTDYYDTGRFTGPVTKDSPLWEAGGFVGGDRYEPTLGPRKMLHWSDPTAGVGQETPLFLHGGPVDTGAIRGGYKPTTPEQQTEGQRWLDQLTGAYETYQKTPYSTFASTATTPGLQAQQGQWNTAADEYNRRVMAAREKGDELTKEQECAARGTPWTWNGSECVLPPDEPTLQQQCEARGPEWQWNGSDCVPKTVIDEGAEECASRGAPWFWNGTSCVLPDGDPSTDLQQQCRDAGGDWYGGECHFDDTRKSGVSGSSTFDKYPGWPGVDETGTIESDDASIPAVDPDVQEFFTHDVGTDPLSQITNLALSNLIDTGGVVSTPFTAQTEGELSDIMANKGYLPPTDYERDLKQQYQGVIDEGGVQPLTDLERETQENLWELINRGGQIPLDEQRRAMQIESARSPIDALRRAQLSQGQAAMAGRGTLGQGPETDYMQRVETRLAPMYAQAAQSIALEEAQAADDRYQTALQQLNQQALQGRISADQHAQQARDLQSAMAMDIARRQDDRLMTAIQTSADLTTAQSANLVDAVNAMTGVQQMRTDSAIRVLDQNRLWNEFLATYGLDRAKTLNDMQQGRYLHLMPMIQQFMNMLQISTGGFVDQ